MTISSLKKLISIICPVYNEQVNINMFYDRMQAAIASLNSSYDFEYIFTNNRSTDKTLDLLTSLREQDKRVQVITFSRNFGYQASVLAGLSHASGDASIVIDVDCEDPPEMIPRFLAGWRELDPVASKNRGLISLMRRHRHNLKPEQKAKLRLHLEAQPALAVIYRYKQRLCYLLKRKHRTRKQRRQKCGNRRHGPHRPQCRAPSAALRLPDLRDR
jgi:glycosyltransferase involved in cell wall biosynthesis